MKEVHFAKMINKWFEFEEAIMITTVARGMLEKNVGGNLMVLFSFIFSILPHQSFQVQSDRDSLKVGQEWRLTSFSMGKFLGNLLSAILGSLMNIRWKNL